MSDESPRDGNRPDGRPSRLFFDDLPDEPDGRPNEDRPRPVVTTPAASARRRQEIEESLVDTGPMEPIREPIAEPARTGQQLYFDDIDETEPAPDEPDEDGSTRKAVPSMLGGATTLGGRRGRHLPIGAVLAVLGVLVLVAVIASIGGRSGGNGDGKKALADSTSSVKHSPAKPKHSAAAPPSGQGIGQTGNAGNSPSPKPTIHVPDSPSKSAAAPPTAALMKQPLTVLNNTTIHGLAQQAASTFTSRGWNVGGVGNYTGQIPSTTVYYDAGNTTQQQAAAALAGQFAGLMQAAPRFAGLPGSGLTVVLAPNWSA